MSDNIQFSSRVGDDGILNVQIALGHSKANQEVLVTVIPTGTLEPTTKEAPQSWAEFLNQTYGSCANLGLERATQGDLEQREPMV